MSGMFGSFCCLGIYFTFLLIVDPTQKDLMLEPEKHYYRFSPREQQLTLNSSGPSYLNLTFQNSHRVKKKSYF